MTANGNRFDCERLANHSASGQRNAAGLQNRIVGRIVAAVLLVAAFAFYNYHRHEKWRMIGRDDYIAQRAKAYDAVFVKPATVGGALVVGMLIARGVVVVYEGLAFGLYGILLVLFPNKKTLLSPPSSPSAPLAPESGELK